MTVGVSQSETHTAESVQETLKNLRNNTIRGLKHRADKFQKEYVEYAFIVSNACVSQVVH